MFASLWALRSLQCALAKLRHRTVYCNRPCLFGCLWVCRPGNCTYVECTTSIGDPVWDTLLASSCKAGIGDYYGHWATSRDHRPLVILDHRLLHFTGRWRWRWIQLHASILIKLVPCTNQNKIWHGGTFATPNFILIDLSVQRVTLHSIHAIRLDCNVMAPSG